MPENAAENVVEEQKKVPEPKKMSISALLVFLCNTSQVLYYREV